MLHKRLYIQHILDTYRHSWLSIYSTCMPVVTISDLWTEFKMDQYYPMVTKIYYLDIKTEVLVYSYTNISHINAKH